MKRNFKKNSIVLIIILITFFTFFDKISALTAEISNPLSSSSISYKTKNVNKTRYFKYLGVYSLDEKNIFCLEPGISFKSGKNFIKKTYDQYRSLRGNNGFTLNATQKELLAKVSTVAKNSNDMEKLATQALYWEIITGERTTFTTCDSGNCNPDASVSGGLYETLNNNSGLQTEEGNKIRKIIEAYDEIVNNVYIVFTKNPGNVFKIDSLAKEDSPQVLKYDKNTEKWTNTITDSDSSFSYWKVVDDYPDYITVEKKDNSITISSTIEIDDSVAIKIKTNNNDSTSLGNIDIYINNDNKTSQALIDVEKTEISKYVYVTTEKNTYGLKITKKDEATENHLTGATFELCSDSECNDVIDTDTTWRLSSLSPTRPATFLVEEPGIYYYREVTAPEGYIAEKTQDGDPVIHKVEITYGNAYNGFDSDYLNLFGDPVEVTVYNTKEPTTTQKVIEPEEEIFYQLKINKIDASTKEPLEGVQFRICSDVNCQNIISTLKTDKNGEIKVQKLDKLGTYYAVETKTLDGYILDSTPHEIEVTEQNIDDTNSYAQITIENNKKTYGFNLTKNTMDENGNVTKLDDACYSEERDQKSAVFTVTSKNGKLKFKEDENEKGKYVVSNDEDAKEEIKTCNGEFSVEGLNECEYTITETKSPTGVLPPNASKNVNVCGSDKNISFTNGFTGLEFQKKNENGNFISGGKFALEQKINGTWMNVQIKKKNTGVFTYSKDEGEYLFETNEGIAYISGLPVGEYRVVEKEAPADYELIEVADSPKITISDEYKDGYYILTMINHKVNKNGGDASAELVITITTGRKVLNYVLIVASLAALLVIAIIVRKKIKK